MSAPTGVPASERAPARRGGTRRLTVVEGIELIQILRGEILYRQGDPGTNMHIVPTGRLQVRVRDKEGTEKIVASLSPGESVGEMALFTGANRAATVVAVRDTTLGLLTRDTFDAVMTKHAIIIESWCRMREQARRAPSPEHVATDIGGGSSS